MNHRAVFRWVPNWWLLIGGFGVFTALLFVFAIPNFVRHGPGKINAILTNLKQIEGAGQLWAISRGETGAVPTWADIAPYLQPASGAPGTVRPVAGERYVLKPLRQTPEAVLTREVAGHPAGTIMRFSTNGHLEILPPKND